MNSHHYLLLLLWYTSVDNTSHENMIRAKFMSTFHKAYGQATIDISVKSAPQSYAPPKKLHETITTVDHDRCSPVESSRKVQQMLGRQRHQALIRSTTKKQDMQHGGSCIMIISGPIQASTRDENVQVILQQNTPMLMLIPHEAAGLDNHCAATERRKVPTAKD